MLIIQNQKEWDDLIESLTITKMCRYYDISEEDRLQALMNAKVPFVANNLIKRIGVDQFVSKKVVDNLREEHKSNPNLDRLIGHIQVLSLQVFWLEKKYIKEELSQEETNLLIELFIHYSSLVGIKKTKSDVAFYHYKFTLDWEGEDANVFN